MDSESAVFGTARAVVLGVGALYAVSSEPAEAQACFWCNSDSYSAWCTWDQITSGYQGCYVNGEANDCVYNYVGCWAC